MARIRGGVPARLGWLAMILGVGGVGCSTPVDYYDGYNSERPSRTIGQGATDSSRGDVVRTMYQAPMAPKGGYNETQGFSPGKPGSLPALDGGPAEAPPPQPLPTELAMTTLPSYIIEPPDILFIDAIRIVPKPPYRIEPLDVLLIQVNETIPQQPIGGTTPYPVSPDGTVNLGFSYGMVRVAGLTMEEAARNIQQHLRRSLNNPTVSVTLAQFRGVQQTRGEHLVQMDGCISLGSYGCVHVTGLTVSQAKCVVEKHLSRWLLNPEISLSVAAFNSKVYYVIFDGGGYGQQVFRLPITGKDTVLDAISQINGLPPISSTRKIWVARPTPAKKGCYQILPVNWQVLTQAGDTETNYQLFPGDRIYVKANCLLHFNNRLSQVLYPVNNAAGSTLIGFGAASIVRGVTSGTSTSTGLIR